MGEKRVNFDREGLSHHVDAMSHSEDHSVDVHHARQLTVRQPARVAERGRLNKKEKTGRDGVQVPVRRACRVSPGSVTRLERSQHEQALKISSGDKKRRWAGVRSFGSSFPNCRQKENRDKIKTRKQQNQGEKDKKPTRTQHKLQTTKQKQISRHAEQQRSPQNGRTRETPNEEGIEGRKTGHAHKKIEATMKTNLRNAHLRAALQHMRPLRPAQCTLLPLRHRRLALSCSSWVFRKASFFFGRWTRGAHWKGGSPPPVLF
jgi:hypothetical protein